MSGQVVGEGRWELIFQAHGDHAHLMVLDHRTETFSDIALSEDSALALGDKLFHWYYSRKAQPGEVSS